MNKATEMFERTLEALEGVQAAAEEFYNEELILMGKHADEGRFEGFFEKEDVPSLLRPHIESRILPIFEKNGFLVKKEKLTGLFGGEFYRYHINWYQNKGEEQ